MGIGALLLVSIFTLKVVKEYNVNKEEEIILRDGKMMTLKEVKYLLSFLGLEEDDFEDISDAKLEDNLADGNKQSDESYKSSNNMQSDESHNPSDNDGDIIKLAERYPYITFKDVTNILPLLADKVDLDIELVMEEVSFQIQEEKPNKAVLVSEFLEIYEEVLESIPVDSRPVKEKEFLIVGIPDRFKQDIDKKIMATNQGNFVFDNALNYDPFYINGKLITEINEEDNKKDEGNIKDGDNIKDIDKSVKDRDESKEYIDNETNKFHIEDFIDHKISALVAGEDLVYVKEILNDETILHNAWITSGSGQIVKGFVHEVTKEFNTKSNLSEEINGVVGDLIIKNREIVGIRIKPDRIEGKVLVTEKEYIEVKGYGQIPLDDNYKIYKIYGELAQELTNSILVGYETTDFIVAEGKIVAALIKEEIKAENIRVLIKTNKFSDYYHNEVSFTSNSDFTIGYGDESIPQAAGTVINVREGDELLTDGRLTIKASSETGKIQLLSLDRSHGSPAYRGAVEIAPSEKGLLIVNELSLEEYLYAVVPSEMPSYYSIEALKSQAVCARSYAFNHLMANSLKEYGAHVDDSVSFQVYNNIEENEKTLLAVKDTYGKVITYDGLIINAYYFSTSSGHTASVGEVWSGDLEYLKGKLQVVVGDDGVTATSTQDEVDFSNEEAFRSFIQNPSYPTYDSEFAWYRWKVTLPYSEITNNVNSKIEGRYNANSANIQTLVKNEAGEEVYESHPVTSVGTVENIQILKREKSGIITELKIVGSSKTVKVVGEYNVRIILSPGNQKVIRQDDSEVSQAMLPSAFFVMDKADGGISITGGGYGHGVGMSQNGAKAMADQGKEYDEILKHYYSGVELGYIYE